MKFFNIDLHIHSVLSPCADLEMSPKNIIKTAIKKDLHIIAITDHNSSKQCYTIEKLSKKFKEIKIIYGIEVQTIEQVHLLCYFKNSKDCIEFGNLIYKYLPNIKNDEDIFGFQLVVDETDEIIDKEEKLLINSVNLTIDDILHLAKDFEGIVIPAHIQSSFGLIYTLSDINAWQEKFPLMEIAYNNLNYNLNYRVITSSDAHYLKDIKRGYFQVYLDKFDFEKLFLDNIEIKLFQKRR